MISKQENGKWLVDIRNDGRGSKRARKIFETKRQASEFENWFKAQQTLDIWVKQKDNRRLSDAIERTWIEVGKFQSSGKDKHSRLLKIADALNNPLLKDIDAEMLMKYRSERIENGLSQSTANKEMTYILSVLTHVGVDKPKVKQLKVKTDEMSYLTDPEIKKLLVHLKRVSIKAYALCRTCLETGARWGEASAIQRSQIQSGMLTLPSKHTKNNKPRYIPISSNLSELLNSNLPFEDYLDTFRYAIKVCAIELPPGQLTHVMRHTFAANFMIKGGNIITLQRVLDHGDLKTTMRYAHLSQNHLQDVLIFKPITEFE